MRDNWCSECGVVWVERKGDKCQECQRRERQDKIDARLLEVRKNDDLHRHRHPSKWQKWQTKRENQ